MLELARYAGWLLSPLTVALLLGLVAVVLWRRKPRGARLMAVSGFAILWLGSTPVVGHLLAVPLENRYASAPLEAAPRGDAILVLGGAVSGTHLPYRPNLGLGPSADRVWQAAALYRAGKAPWVIVAAGNLVPRPGLESEAHAITRILVQLGVPPERIRVDAESRNTRENAANSLPILRQIGARSVLLVSSAHHLPRAVRTFERGWEGSGIALIPVPADVPARDADYFTPWAWLPSTDTLRFVTRTLKEYAGIAVLGIM